MGNLGSIAMGVGRKKSKSGPQKEVDIIEFAEAGWGLNQKLYPAQKVLLKAFYGVPLDDHDKCVEISDWRRQNWRSLTEAEFLRYLYDEGRSSIREVTPGRERHELVLAIGRRSGKTLLASIIAAYETYKLILKECPQAYYGLPRTNDIGIISVATDKGQAGLLYTNVSGYFAECAFFTPYLANSTMSYSRLQTPYDIERYGRFEEEDTARSSLLVSFRACVAKGLRGSGNIVIILDELAHFIDEGQSSAKTVYDAVTPSRSAFSPKDPNDFTKPIGPVEGRIISISSPLGRQGQFYDLYQIAMRGGLASEDMLAIQAPTWEINPTIPAGELEKHYITDQIVFFTEYGAQFTDRSRGWIERAEDLEACIDPKARPVVVAPARRAHFMGIDVGLSLDGSAAAIGHLERRGDNLVIVADLIDHIKAGEGAFVDCDRLDFDEVADWILDLSKRFYIAEGIFDQYVGIPFEQALAKRGLGQIVSEKFPRAQTSQMFQNFKDMMFDKRLVLYDFPIEENHVHCAYIEELLELQALMISKYIVLVEAPNVEGKHDDRSDALIRMVWLASQNLTKPKYLSSPGGIVTSLMGQDAHQVAVNYRREAAIAQMKARRMGSHPSRQRSPTHRGSIRGRR